MMDSNRPLLKISDAKIKMSKFDSKPLSISIIGEYCQGGSR